MLVSWLHEYPVLNPTSVVHLPFTVTLAAFRLHACHTAI